jgi:hypothetical protein
MATVTKKRPGTTKPTGKSTEFPAGSLEAELSAIGRSVPTEEWEKIPPDYFANLDYYRYGGLKKK